MVRSGWGGVRARAACVCSGVCRASCGVVQRFVSETNSVRELATVVTEIDERSVERQTPRTAHMSVPFAVSSHREPVDVQEIVEMRQGR